LILVFHTYCSCSVLGPLCALCALCGEKGFGFRSSHTMFLVFSREGPAGLRLCSTPSLRSGHFVCGEKDFELVFSFSIQMLKIKL
jgi:hypothetical protein